ncbi:LytTR family DNA-binding domain-containing protein [Lacticaseibacillus sharpeae]|uniref:HTH LytTR-type domain-containing protein n=1 Tax=Lacticaseibacillus sharpeae JCM 1186 = DSM 20505 TaxID=1291052 RepID=A0A0R1ZMI3_9LACO|nr:LytTR family DNA-binding domain-containing protein [Lacticaseibacillus sharpeae]KRM54308.1 hypothetical protein FC18_GL000527 [Lacticaseibacillus sharpeae JCM 1186 = DSM 20505]
MQVKFEQVAGASAEPEVIVRAAALSPEVLTLMARLQNGVAAATLAIPVADRIVIVDCQQIVAASVLGERLTLTTTEATYEYAGQLNGLLQRLTAPNFVQVSRNSLLNIQHLRSLEQAFSGNMLALMSTGTKIVVSRKFLPQLKRSVGL